MYERGSEWSKIGFENWMFLYMIIWIFVSKVCNGVFWLIGVILNIRILLFYYLLMDSLCNY